jgi:hypothetical protein
VDKAFEVKQSLPVFLAFAVGSLFMVWRLAEKGWEPAALAEIGAVTAEGAIVNSSGYDGQFAFFIAMDPNPANLMDKLDVPSYRYQRILYPVIARLVGLGNPDLIAWSLLVVNLLAHGVGTWAVARLLGEHAIYAAAYALWVGLIAPIGLDLTEPLAYMLVALSWLARRNERPYLSGGLLTLAFFAKETTLVFALAFLLQDLFVLRNRESAASILAGLGAFAVFQAWLFFSFGEIGIGSGGAMSTPFELFPFWGLLRIGLVSMPALALFAVIFGPTIVIPAIWGISRGLRQWKDRRFTADGLALALNGVAVAFLPFSTFREPLGLVRFADGLVLALLVFSAAENRLRPLRYALFWSALLVMLVSR